jgi:DNA-3-methyladenine glycosylase II
MKPIYWDIGVAYLSQHDKILEKIISEYQGETLTIRGDAFYTLARSIIGQQISVKAADSVWKKVENIINPLTPEITLQKSEIELKNCGLSASKIRYLLSLANFFITNKNIEKTWQNLPDAEIINMLISINGIGRWTAEMFMIFYLARPDIFPIADIGVQKAIFRHYNNSDKLAVSEIRTISENWQPYRTIATWYLWRSLDPVPVAY